MLPTRLYGVQRDSFILSVPIVSCSFHVSDSEHIAGNFGIGWADIICTLGFVQLLRSKYIPRNFFLNTFTLFCNRTNEMHFLSFIFENNL